MVRSKPTHPHLARFIPAQGPISRNIKHNPSADVPSVLSCTTPGDARKSYDFLMGELKAGNTSLKHETVEVTAGYLCDYGMAIEAQELIMFALDVLEQRDRFSSGNIQWTIGALCDQKKVLGAYELTMYILEKRPKLKIAEGNAQYTLMELCNAKKFEEALNLFLALLEKGYSLKSTTVQSMAVSMARNRQAEKAHEVIVEAQKKGILEPDAVQSVAAELIKDFDLESKWIEKFNPDAVYDFIVLEMKMGFRFDNTEVMDFAIKHLEDLGRLTEAIKFLQLSAEQNCRFSPEMIKHLSTVVK